MNVADYQTIAMVLHAFDERTFSGVEEIAARVGLGGRELEHLFARWAGGDGSRFLQSLALDSLRKRLAETRKLLAGSRLPPWFGMDDSFHSEGGCRVRLLASGQRQGRGVTIRHGLYPSPFGDCFLAMSGDAVCHLSFVNEGKWQEHVDGLHQVWPQARITEDADAAGRRLVERIFASTGMDSPEAVSLLLMGTPFQLQVWRALLALPMGGLISYQDLAVFVGHPTAWRAVASAVAANPVSYLIPCHRVIRKSGAIYNYRWGSSRKKAMLAWEACRS